MKHGDYSVCARDNAERDRAYLHLFRLMDGYGFYANVDGDESDWLKGARKGDARSARWLLDCRSSYEYESLEFIYPKTPI